MEAVDPGKKQGIGIPDGFAVPQGDQDDADPPGRLYLRNIRFLFHLSLCFYLTLKTT